MIRDQLAPSLHRLGIDRNNYKVLKLLPLIYVAWADGEIEDVKKERLIAAAHNYFDVGPRGEAVLRGWMKEKPTKAYFLEGLHDIFLLAHAPDDWDFDLDELPGLLAHAEAIARTTAEAMDEPTAVSAAEEQALADIARELEIDDGETWARLIGELGEER